MTGIYALFVHSRNIEYFSSIEIWKTKISTYFHYHFWEFSYEYFVGKNRPYRRFLWSMF